VITVVALNATAGEITRTFQVTGPTIIGFLPPEIENGGANGEDEAIAHVLFALDDTAVCLRRYRALKMQTIFADRLIVRDGAKSHTVVLNKGQGIGAVLLRPGKAPRTVFAAEGASTLIQTLPNEAVTFYGRKCANG
jgi:hypothetical protein